MLYYKALNFMRLLPRLTSPTINNYNVLSFEKKAKDHDLIVISKTRWGFFCVCFVLEIPGITPTL